MRLISESMSTKKETSSYSKSYSNSYSNYSLTKSSSSRPSSKPPLPNYWPHYNSNFGLQKSHSTSTVETTRGFKPSDRKDPAKKAFLTNLTKRVFRVSDENAPPPHPVNLEKIFTPADGEQIQPKSNRKMFASSAFYAKGVHPTVEEQVELAKRISSSLSDISNKTSKGQSMYVNRKKRSVKWVHEGEGQALDEGQVSICPQKPKDPLKLVMNPHGQIQDINTLRKQGVSIEPALSPDVCLEIVKDLNSPKGKGAELFAKRRKRSEKWVVGESNGTRHTPLPDISPSPTPLLSPLPPLSSFPPPSYLPESQQRIQHKQNLDEIQEQFAKPRVKLVKSPWEAALETGSVDTAFQDVSPGKSLRGNWVAPVVDSYERALRSDTLDSWTGPPPKQPDAYHYRGGGNTHRTFNHNPAYDSSSINRIVDNYQKGSTSNVDVYKPALPQAWNTATNYSQPKQQYYSSNTLPRSKPKPPLSPTYRPSATPPIFVPKESDIPVTGYFTPAYNSQYGTQQSTLGTEYVAPSSTSPKIDYNSLNNYNTAPRGWGSNTQYYKPVTFDKSVRPTYYASDYTDF